MKDYTYTIRTYMHESAYSLIIYNRIINTINTYRYNYLCVAFLL